MLARLVLSSWPHDPPTSASQSAGITGVSHWARSLAEVWLKQVPTKHHINLPLCTEYVFFKKQTTPRSGLPLSMLTPSQQCPDCSVFLLWMGEHSLPPRMWCLEYSKGLSSRFLSTHSSIIPLIHLSFYPSVYPPSHTLDPSIHLSIHPFTQPPSIHLSTCHHPPTNLPIYHSYTHSSILPPTYLSIHPSTHPPIHLSIHLPFCLTFTKHI